MHSDVLVVARRDRLPHLEARGGIAARSTGPHTVHLVSAAATPLGGDTVTVRVIVEPGARLRLRSVAATLVLPGATTRASAARLDLEVCGDLDIDLQPTVVAADAEHRTTIHASIGETGAIRLRERIQVGRSGERDGFWSGSLHADACGRPLLRHRVEIGAGGVADDVISAPRASISELQYPTTQSWQSWSHPDLTVLELAAGGALATWQGDVLPA